MPRAEAPRPFRPPGVPPVSLSRLYCDGENADKIPSCRCRRAKCTADGDFNGKES